MPAHHNVGLRMPEPLATPSPSGPSTVVLERPSPHPAPAHLPAPQPSAWASPLLDQVIRRTEAAPAGAAGAAAPDVRPSPPSWLDDFLAADEPAQALAIWLARMNAGRPAPASADELRILLDAHVAAIDALLTRQVNAVIHHERFQQLEASWRGLRYLTEQFEPHPDPAVGVKVRVLNVSWADLKKNFDRCQDVQDSKLFQAVYEEEFGHAGGLPFGVLLGDYTVRRTPDGHPLSDLEALEMISKVSAAAFAPFVGAAAPDMLGLADYAHIDRPTDLSAIFQQADYLRWRSFRDSEDSRFVGLTLPRVLMRTPHPDDGSRADGFRFRESVASREELLWGNAAYAFGAVLIRAFSEGGWFADIRGFRRDAVSGGLVTRLPAHYFATDRRGVAARFPLEVAVDDHREKELADLGFIPLCHAKDTEFCVFYSNQSVQKPKAYDKGVATTNARISSMLQYMLCASRFAHYLKVLARDRVGSTADEKTLGDQLRNWLATYVANDENASHEVRARFPLREADVTVSPDPGRPGSYTCVMHLLPHSQLDALSVGVRLRTELSRPQVR